MKFILSCSACIVKQAAQIAQAMGLDEQKSQKLLRLMLEKLAAADYNLSTPTIMGSMWDLLEREFGKRDVYEQVKRDYDNAVLAQLPALAAAVQAADSDRERFNKALLFAVCGNLIDLAAAHSFDVADFLSKAEALGSEQDGRHPFGVDDRERLYSRLSSASTVLYLGDNCGEIVTDRLFIQEIRRQFPSVKVFYAVKEKAVLNDVTLLDADIAGMADVAEVITNGDGAAGTVLADVSDEFRSVFYAADVIISKGQGNFEGMYPMETPRDGIFFLMMAKCAVIADLFGVKPMSLICKEAYRSEK